MRAVIICAMVLILAADAWALPPGLAKVRERAAALPSDARAASGIRVAFAGPAVYVTSRRELSNVVLEYEDGARQRFEDLYGTSATFTGAGSHRNKTIVRVWVKAGANFSGDGPGYGQRFEAPRRY